MEQLLKAKQETLEDLNEVEKQMALLNEQKIELQADLNALDRLIRRVEGQQKVVSEERSDIKNIEQGGQTVDACI